MRSMYNNNPHSIANETRAATTAVVSGPNECDTVYRVNHYLNTIFTIFKPLHFHSSFYIIVCNSEIASYNLIFLILYVIVVIVLKSFFLLF